MCPRATVGRRVHRAPLRRHTRFERVSDIRFSPDSCWIAVANADASDVSAVFCTSEQVNATPMSIEGASQKFLT